MDRTNYTDQALALRLRCNDKDAFIVLVLRYEQPPVGQPITSRPRSGYSSPARLDARMPTHYRQGLLQDLRAEEVTVGGDHRAKALSRVVGAGGERF